MSSRAERAMFYAKLYCKKLDSIKFIGITGTNGKSTTAIMIRSILSDFGYKVGLIGTGKIMLGDQTLSDENYSMTTPSPEVLYSAIGKMEDMGAEIIVMEVSSHALDQERIFPIDFHIGIFTNLSHEHLDYHESIEKYFEAKSKLFKKSNYKIINTDDYYGKSLYENMLNSENCAIENNAKNRISNIEDYGFDGLRFEYTSECNSFTVNLKLPGKYNAYNALLAIKAGELMKVPGLKIKESLEKIDSIDGRFNVMGNKIKVVIDYAHTSSAFCNLLISLFSYKKQGQKLIVVFGCGGNRDKHKRNIMGETAEKYSDTVILTSDNPRDENPESIMEDIESGMKISPLKIVNRECAIRKAISIANVGDIVCIVGKGPERYIIKNGVYTPFDEKTIIASALKERGLCE